MLPPTVNEYLRLQATLEKNAKEAAKKKRQQQSQSLTPQQQLLITPK